MRIELNWQGNEVLKKIKYTAQQTESNKQIENDIKEIQKHKDNSTSSHQTMRKIKSKKRNTA